jgi:hypothetical protein
MNPTLNQLIDESIKLELNMASLYKIFSTTFPNDGVFWYELYLEEKKHANITQTAKDLLLSCHEFPVEVLATSLVDLIKVNNMIVDFPNFAGQ